jgi:two-component system sensor histidine kinase DegS
MELNRDFKLYSEIDMLDTYKETIEAQIKLQLLESKEQKLRTKRDNLERSLNQRQLTIERAENLLSHIGFTISLLEGEIVNATSSSKIMQR